MIPDYSDFLATKHVTVEPSGFTVKPDDIDSRLFLFQRDIVRWSLGLGRAALFENVGLGKTIQQLSWSQQVADHTNHPVLILAPLAVAEQTVSEGKKFGIEVKHAQEQSDVGDAGIVITNYDRAHLFDEKKFRAVVLDESSILKHYSKTFFALHNKFEKTPFKLCCTATPAPNDWVELGNHAMFLGIMHFKDMLARWFVGEGDIARTARLKNFARADFWRWLTIWAVCVSNPSDLGERYAMPGYDLPPLHVHEHRLGMSEATVKRAWADGRLIPDTQPSATDFQRVKKESLQQRVEKTAEIFTAIPDDEPVIIWCDTDFEADALLEAFPKAIDVRGSQPPAKKEAGLRAFTNREQRLIITKPEIAGFGLNWQHCAHMIFAGVSFSFERTYQALGRVHRYGQTRDVHAHLIYAETEGNVMQILKEKQTAFAEMQAEMNAAMREHGLFREGKTVSFSKSQRDVTKGKDWTYHLGDCVEVMPTLDDNSVDLTVTSIPFSNLYIYSDSEADVGNAADKDEFFGHMAFVIKELLRITKPGRCCAVHVKDLPLFQNRDGVMGIDPFSDDVTAAFRAARLRSEAHLPDAERTKWVLQSRVTIEKDPVIEMKKTDSHGLLMKNFKERAELLRVGLPDYVLIFQKTGDIDSNRVKHDPNDETYFGTNPPKKHEWLNLPTRGKGANNYNLPVWQRYANPNWSDVMVPLVWTDIQQTKVLNWKVAKGNQDERHICPLQLDLIGRLIHWKSNPGDMVFDPFGGIGSTGFEALKAGRKATLVELKPEYYNLGVKHLQEAEAQAATPDMFMYLEMQKDKVE